MTRSRQASAQRPLPPAAFVDRVMAAVRLEVPPTPARALSGALRRRSLSDAGSALAVAWHLSTVRSWEVAPSVRVRSMALVLAVALALISGSVAAAGAVRLASDPVTRLFQAHDDDRGPLAIPPATVNEPGNVDPNANDEDELEPAGDDPAGAADDEDDRDDAADAEESTDADADEADDDAVEPEDDVDEAETDEAEPDESGIDQPEADEPDTDDDADSSDTGEASDDEGSGSETDDWPLGQP
jgi:hypothetical protein